MPKTYTRVESYHAGAYWGPRKEAPKGCARRAETFLAAIAQIDPAFSQWFELSRSRKDVLKRSIEPSGGALEKRIQQGRDRQFEELGYSVWARNGELDAYDSCGFHFTCGGYSEGLFNNCVVNLPSRGPNAERILRAPVLTELVRCMVLAWEPDSALATSSMLSAAVTPDGGADTFVGWILYFARNHGAVPSLPSPVHVEPIENKGTLIILVPEKLTVGNPEHVELSRRVNEVLSVRLAAIGNP